MAIGIVKWFNETKGYGFIQPEKGGADVFVHMTSLEKTGINNLKTGQKVSYELAKNTGKIAAVDVKLV